MNKKVTNERKVFIEMCSCCGLHGHIRFPGGNISYEFYSQDEGVEVIEENLCENSITKDEADLLSSEVVKITFLENQMLPQLEDMINKLKTTEHPPEVVEEIIAVLYDILDQIYTRHCGENNPETEKVVGEPAHHTLH